MNGQELTTEEYPVPDNMVGLIIGRGGDQITKIQADTGCRVAVVPQPTGSVTRPCTLTGTTEQILGKYRWFSYCKNQLTLGLQYSNSIVPYRFSVVVESRWEYINI